MLLNHRELLTVKGVAGAQGKCLKFPREADTVRHWEASLRAVIDKKQLTNFTS